VCAPACHSACWKGRRKQIIVEAEEVAGNDPSLDLALYVEKEAIRLLEQYKPGRKLYTNLYAQRFRPRVFCFVHPMSEAHQAFSLHKLRCQICLALYVEKEAIRLLEQYKPGRKLYTNVEFYAAAVMPPLLQPLCAALPPAGLLFCTPYVRSPSGVLPS
jgi:hypothetical protein